ncbi:hypothetical protein M885DRAFT_572741 [Pelagophyceae sp. CCMP2097]|nr:hypothetical protein M885DRAFT_572741 [Pelagophyceae sp. CCMP2097]
MSDPAPAANTRNHHKRMPSETRNKPKRRKDGADGMDESGDKGESYYKAGTSVLEQADALLHRAEVKSALKRSGSTKKTKTRYFLVQTNFGRFSVKIIGPEAGSVLIHLLIMGLNQVRLGYDSRAAGGGGYKFKNAQALSPFVSSYNNPVLQTTDDFVQYSFFLRTHLKLTPVKLPITKIAYQDIVREIPVRHRWAHVDEFAIRGVMALLDEDTGGFQAIHPEDLCDESFMPRVRDAPVLIFDGGESYGVEATPMEGIDITDETAPGVAPEETPLVEEAMVFVETSQYALTNIEGSVLTEHRVELPEAEYDEMLLKLDKLRSFVVSCGVTPGVG